MIEKLMLHMTDLSDGVLIAINALNRLVLTPGLLPGYQSLSAYSNICSLKEQCICDMAKREVLFGS